MDQSQPGGTTLMNERYEILAQDAQGLVEVIDHAPWRRCWACDSRANDAGESFCTDCGAALEQRRYRGVLLPADAPAGLALVADVTDEEARAILPELWDRVETEAHVLVLQREPGHDPVAPPVDELAALQIGGDLARLLAVLHDQGLALGALSPADITLTAANRPRLSQVPQLQRIADDSRAEVVHAELQELAALLESLTDTPRTTRRLGEEEALAAADVPDLAAILRRIRTGTITDAADLSGQLEGLLVERTRPFPLRQEVGAASDTGIIREHNEDSLFTLALTLNNDSTEHTWGLYIVADGMGGHAAGEVASGLAIRGASEVILREYLAPTLDQNSLYNAEQARAIIQQAALQANYYVLHEGQMRGNDMGTTLTMALVIGDRVTIANVGDSRAYLYRDGKLRRVSRDHSLVMRLVELGQIGEEDIYTHPQRNAVLRSLGDKADIEIDLFDERLFSGDALLLCSDGQWEMTRDADMEQVIARYPDDPQQACRQLIEAANQAGGEDNITCILVWFV